MDSKYQQQADRCVSSVFKEHDDLDKVVRQLYDRDDQGVLSQPKAS